MDPVGDVADRDFLFTAQGHRPAHMRRLTIPCRLETALAWRLRRNARTVMQNDSCGFCGVDAAQPTSESCERPNSSASGPTCSSTMWIEAIVPGGDRRVRGEDAHGGRLAKRFVEASPSLLHSFADEFQPGEGGVPFVHVDHARLDAQRLRARTPPMPRMISWRMRVRWSPPYSRAVRWRSSSLFWGMSVSSRNSANAARH